MSRHPSFRRPTFRHAIGKPSPRERCFDGVPITRGVHDNHYCSVNPRFVAVVTECSGGGSFLVLPVHHTGRVDPLLPRVCGHSGRVLDVKWNPFDDFCVASCSEDCTVKIWDIPVCGVQQNLVQSRKTLIGHSRRVGLIEWHPTAENLLLSSAYDYKVLLWDVSLIGAVIRSPVRVVLMPIHHRYPSEALLLSVSFSGDGSRLAVASKDRRVRVLDPRKGKILQVSSAKLHKANKVLYIGGSKILLSTGSSPWNHRQIILWNPDDLSRPLFEEEVDVSAGVLFPFYDPDTRMLYLAGKGDGNIRSYELSADEPRISFLTEFRSLLPQKGLGVMPTRGLDHTSCEVFRFYRLIPMKHLVEPLSVIVPRKQVGLSAVRQRNLLGWNSGSSLLVSGWNLPKVSLKVDGHLPNPYPQCPADGAGQSPVVTEEAFLEEQLAYQDAKYPRAPSDLSGWQPDETQCALWTYRFTPHCSEPAERAPPPRAHDELLQAFHRQQQQIWELEAELHHRDVRIAELELEIRHSRNDLSSSF
ncbi:coronin-2A [Salarias fasciatus]|uniref:coronin-2A n=1 Tax=Salarias fasciatus TaxID=181472 RepID=UPI0011769EF8|nr:coronin-2A-like [Salarias fasciatus]